MYKLFVVWYNGEKEVHEYNTREEAQEAADGIKMAFGGQVWTGIS